MNDNQGRPPFYDEGRIEHHKKRPLENYPGLDDEGPPPPGGGGGVGPLKDSIANRVSQLLSTGSNRGGNKMGTQQSLEDQLRWCNQSRRNLQGLQQDLRNAALTFIGTVDELRSQQYLQELLARIAPLCDEFNDLAYQTSQHIEDAHIEYVMQQADSVCNQITVINQLGRK